MSERLTIADSKKAFHSAFPHVIPPIYRRLTDELLVELHLLSHQKDFKPNSIFAIGLINVFDSFTQGYRPEEHLEGLFEAICKSNGLDPISLRNQCRKTLEIIKGNSQEEIESWFSNKGEGAPERLSTELNELSKGRSHYSRLFAIGLLTLIKGTKVESSNNQDISNDIIKEISNIYGFSSSRFERDISQYKNNLEKISQALELMKETVTSERKKKESRKEKHKDAELK